MFSKEVSFRSPGEFARNVPWNNHCELLVGEVASEEEKEIIGFLVVPGGINPSVNHCYLTQVVLCIEYRDGLNPVSVVVSPVKLRVPPVIIAVHVPAPINISISGVIKYIVVVKVCIVMIVEFHIPGRIGIVIMVSTIIIPAVILL